MVACMIALSLASCGGDDEQPSASAGDRRDAAKGLKLAYVLHFRGDFTKPIIWGAEDAAREFGADIQILAPQQFDPPAQVKMFQDALATGVKGIVTIPSPADIWRQPVRQATDAGIPVLSANNAAPGIIPLYVGENSVRTGRTTIELLLEEAGENPTGTFLMGNAAPGVLPCEQRIKGVRQQVKRGAPDVRIKGPFNTTGDPTKNFSTWESLIRANPDTMGAIDVCFNRLPSVREKMPNADFLVAGIDLDPVVLEGIKDGFVAATVGQKPYLQGYVPVRLLIEHLAFDKPLPEGWVDIGAEIVTPKNVDDAIARSTSRSKQREFYKPDIDKIFANPQAATKPLELVTDE
jgi:ribose transport system substrate-binding protein